VLYIVYVLFLGSWVLFREGLLGWFVGCQIVEFWFVRFSFMFMQEFFPDVFFLGI
jgi:hypothetical protein